MFFEMVECGADINWARFYKMKGFKIFPFLSFPKFDHNSFKPGHLIYYIFKICMNGLVKIM